MHCAYCGNKLPLWTGYVFHLDGGYWCNACRKVSHVYSAWKMSWLGWVVVAFTLVYIAAALFLSSRLNLPRSVLFVLMTLLYLAVLMPMRLFVPAGARVEKSSTPRLRRARRWRVIAGLATFCAYWIGMAANDADASPTVYLGIVMPAQLLFFGVLLWSLGHEPMIRDDSESE